MYLKHIIRPPIQGHIIATILNQVEFEREGYVINRSAVKGCVTVLSLLEVEVGVQTVYMRDLEPEILRESRIYYEREGERLLETCDAPEFLRRVSHHLCFCLCVALNQCRLRRVLNRRNPELTTTCRHIHRARYDKS